MVAGGNTALLDVAFKEKIEFEDKHKKMVDVHEHSGPEAEFQIFLLFLMKFTNCLYNLMI